MKFGAKLQNTQTHLLRNFGWVGRYWVAEKWLEPQKNEISGFCPVGPSTTKNSFYHHCKVKVFIDNCV